MAFFRNYSSETVSQSFLDDQSQRPRDDRIHRSSGNVDAHVMSCDKEFDMNVDVKYQSEDEQDGPSGLQNEATADEGSGAGVSNSQSSGRRMNVAGKWGSTFWKDCQPMCPQGGSDSGQDTKSGSEYRNAVGSEDNSSDVREDRLDSEDDAGPKVRKGQWGHSDIPADEMLSDEYYEQDGEEQSDSMHYRGFHHLVRSTSRLQPKPAPITNHRTSRLSNNNGNYDDGEDDNENIDGADADADYEEEDEDEDDPDDADFEPDYGVAGGYAAKKDKDWNDQDSDEDNDSDDELDMSDDNNSFYVKNLKGRHRSKGAHTVKLKRERKSYIGSSRQRRRKSSFDDDESSADDSESDSDEGFKSTRRKSAHIRKSNGWTTDVSGRNGEVRASTRSVRKVSYVESEGSDEADEGKKKKSQKEDIEEEDGDYIEKVLWHQPKGMAEDAIRNNRSAEPLLLSHLFDSEPDWSNTEFLIKWKGLSHLHCQWKTFSELQSLSGFKKVVNYTKKVMEDARYRKTISREEIEVHDVSKEMDLDLIKQNSQVERIIADRIKQDSSGDVVPEYLVKWQGLSYAEATWEKDVDIAFAQDAIDEFKAREAAMAVQGKMVDLQRKKSKG